MKKVIITATLTMTVFSAVPLVTPAQAFAASKPAQVHVVEEAPSATAEQSLDFIEADAALATYNSGSLDTINRDDSTLAGKGVSSIPAKVKIWNKNGEDSTKRNSVSVRNLTVDQAVSLWMNEAARMSGNNLYDKKIMINGGRNYAIHLTDGTRDDLRKAMVKKLSQGLSGNIEKTAKNVVNEVLGYKHYGNSTKNEAKALYGNKGIVIMRGTEGISFDGSYWLAKCVIQCSQDMNLAQYENEPQARRDKDVSFAIMEWCRAHVKGYGGKNMSFKNLLSGNAYGVCEHYARYVQKISNAFGIRMGIAHGDDHAINVLKTGGKYYYMDFQDDVRLCDFKSTGYANTVYTPEYSQLLREIANMNLPQKADWDVVSEKVANASPELLALADTVVAQVEAKDVNLVYVERNGVNVYWHDRYETALKYFIAYYAYDYQNNLDMIERLYDDDIVNGRVGKGEAEWLTFKEFACGGEDPLWCYKQTPYGKIYDTSKTSGMTKYRHVLKYKTQTKLLNGKRNSELKHLKVLGQFSNVHVTGN